MPLRQTRLAGINGWKEAYTMGLREGCTTAMPKALEVDVIVLECFFEFNVNAAVCKR